MYRKRNLLLSDWRRREKKIGFRIMQKKMDDEAVLQRATMDDLVT
jgi:hypothetical protein